MDERRKQERIAVSLASRVTPRGEQAAILGPAGGFTINDLSAGGLLLFMPKPLPEGTVLDIEFSLPDDPEPVRASGQVVWTDSVQNQGGVQVVDIERGDSAKIGEWLRQLIESGQIEQSLRELHEGLAAASGGHAATGG